MVGVTRAKLCRLDDVCVLQWDLSKVVQTRDSGKLKEQDDWQPSLTDTHGEQMSAPVVQTMLQTCYCSSK